LQEQSQRVEKMTKVQREEAVAAIPFEGSIGFQRAAYLMFLTPWREAAAAVMLNEANRLGVSPDFDKPAYVKNLIAAYYEKRAASGPEAAEWKRGLRALLLFNADYKRAHELSRELAREHHPTLGLRDELLLGLTERIAGNRKPLDDAISKCPETPKAEIERWGPPSDDPTDYCRTIVVWNIGRAITLSARGSLPNAYIEFLEESSQAKSIDLRSFAIGELERVSPGRADRKWRDLLATPKLPLDWKLRALWGLASNAERDKRWAEGLQWIDQYLDAALPQNPTGFRPELWKVLATTPEARITPRNLISEAFDLKFRLSLGAGDFDNARRTIEDLLVLTTVNARYAFDTRFKLIKLAEAEATAGQREQPLRILGFIARNPLDTYLTGQLDDVRKQLSGSGAAIEPKREDTPWDSRPRDRRTVPQRPTPTVSTS
jgi:hypothetical protein